MFYVSGEDRYILKGTLRLRGCLLQAAICSPVESVAEAQPQPPCLMIGSLESLLLSECELDQSDTSLVSDRTPRGARPPTMRRLLFEMSL